MGLSRAIHNASAAKARVGESKIMIGRKQTEPMLALKSLYRGLRAFAEAGRKMQRICSQNLAAKPCTDVATLERWRKSSALPTYVVE